MKKQSLSLADQLSQLNRILPDPLADFLADKRFTLAEHWNKWVSNRSLKAYFQTAGSCGFLPEGDREIGSLLHLNIVAKELFEISYELNNRPERIRIPLIGILQLLDQSDAALPLPSPGNPKAKGNPS